MSMSIRDYEPIDHPKLDLGMGIFCQRRELRKGHKRIAHGIDWWHPCVGRKIAKAKADWLPLWPTAREGWALELEEPRLTITPSVRCSVCGMHGRIFGGRWIPC